jgi:hypothetical protein
VTIVADPDLSSFRAAQSSAVAGGAPPLTSKKFGPNDAILPALAEQTRLPVVTGNSSVPGQVANRRAAFPTAQVQTLAPMKGGK